MPVPRFSRHQIAIVLIMAVPLLWACAPQALALDTPSAARQHAPLSTTDAATLPTAALIPTPSPVPPTPVATCPPPVVPPADAGPLTALARSSRCPGLVMAAWGAGSTQQGWVAYDPTTMNHATYEALPDAIPPGAVPSVGAAAVGGMV
ncbi:hypothetical protein EKD04_009725 [Chloroflexales bacterium ZM16-3]|nr:hypothetical protein [Chloroflexales bacterium ZM16-3]